MLLALAPAQGSTSSTTLVKSSTVKRLVPGAGLSNAGTRVTLALMKLHAGTYFVELPVTVKHTNPDQVDYVAVSLLCKDMYGHMDQIGQAVNTLHGTSFTLMPRLYITFTGTMRGTCVGYAQATRIRGSSSASSSSRSITVTSAKLIVTPASKSAVETERYKGNTAANNHPFVGHSSRASKGVHFHAAAVPFKLSPSRANSFAVTGDVYLTACISPGGSRDASTNGRNLCTPSVVKSGGTGSLVRTRLVVQQYKADGTTPCRTVFVPNTTTTFAISPMRHHLPKALNGTVTLPVLAGCGSHAKAWTEVYVARAPAVVVHFPSSVTSVRPI
jgi:hypothetical protein